MAAYISKPEIIIAYQVDKDKKNLPDWLKGLITRSVINRDVITVVGGGSWIVNEGDYIIVNSYHEAIAVVDKERFENRYILYKEN